MKKLIIIIVMSCAFSAWSQDTLKFKNGAQEIVTVEEISMTELSYHKFSNLKGPLYRIPKSEIEYVRYQNGDREFFLDPPVVAKPAIISKPEPIVIQGLMLYRYGRPINEKHLYKLAVALPEGDKRSRMLQKYRELEDFRQKQYALQTLGLILTIASPVAGLIMLSENVENQNNYLLAGAGLVTGIVQLVYCAKNKNARLEKRADMAAIYNEE